jgi:probable F420-dependent oxidoreductase
MRFGVHLEAHGPYASPERIGGLAARAEALGFESVWVSDHVVVPTESASPYPGRQSAFTAASTATYFEPIVTLAWVAGATRRVRVGTNVFLVPLRNPVVAAKQLATLDALSGGRLVLGVGVGWLAEEFDALGQPHFRARGTLADEYLRLYRALWTGEPVSFDGRFYQLPSVRSLPTPIQRPGPPIWVGGNSERALRRAAELGDGWAALRLSVEEFRRGAERLRELAAERGRPVPELTTRCNLGPAGPPPSPNDYDLYGEPAAIAAALGRYAAAGCVEVGFNLFPHDSTDGMLESLERFASEIRPLVDPGVAGPAT